MTVQKNQSYRIQRIISIVIILLGLVLLAFMVIVEDEPGALPLLLIIIGTAWLLFIQKKIRKQDK